MIRFDVQATGLPQMASSLGLLARGVKDFSPIWEAIEDDFYQMERDLWATQGHGQWPDNSGLYRERKAEYFPGRVVMELHGDLYKSMTVKGAAGQVRQFTQTSMVIGTSVPHAAIHHYGSDKKMWIPAPFYMWIRGVPKRPLLDVLPADIARWETLGDRVVGDMARKAGL